MNPHSLFGNAKTLAKNPSMAPDFMRWLIAKYVNHMSPVRHFDETIAFTGFASFSEYHGRRNGVDPSDRQVFRSLFATTTPSDSVAIDIGANIGLVSLLLSKIGYHRVFSAEPLSTTFDCFQSNLHLNQNLANAITAYNVGIAEQNGEMQFLYEPRSPEQSKLAPSYYQSSQAHQTSCRVVTLPKFFDDNQIHECFLLKIDVEGFETSVVSGAVDLLKEGKVGYIYSEIIPHALEEAGSSLPEYVDLLTDCGFHSVAFSSNKKNQLCRVPFDHAMKLAAETRNVLFQHKSRFS